MLFLMFLPVDTCAHTHTLHRVWGYVCVCPPHPVQTNAFYTFHCMFMKEPGSFSYNTVDKQCTCCQYKPLILLVCISASVWAFSLCTFPMPPMFYFHLLLISQGCVSQNHNCWRILALLPISNQQSCLLVCNHGFGERTPVGQLPLYI